MTKSTILATVVCCGLHSASAVTSGAGQSQVNAELAQRVAQLPLEPSYVVPGTLAEMVSVAQAAVVARIDRRGDIIWESDTSPSGVVIANPAFGSYHVTIEEVLYNKRTRSAPPLLTGPAVLTQRLGREGATDFLAGKQPAHPNDTCLLFLWHRPGSADWSILQWPLQFRQSAALADSAEPVAPLPGGRATLSQPEWFGSSVAVTKRGQGVVPRWRALVDQVKQLSAIAQK